MKKRILFFLSLSLVVGLGISWLWLTEKGSIEAQDNPPDATPFEVINQKAKLARNGTQPAAEDEVSEIISVAGFESELRGFTSIEIKDRVGRSESHYRQGITAGIPEAKIVRTVNGLVKLFNLPEYVKTSDYEVRKLRLGLLPSFPQVITQKNHATQALSRGSQIDSQMSPAEAVFVLAMMLQQKLTNPEFQMTQSERRSRWTSAHSHSVTQNNPTYTAQTRTQEIKEALRRAALSTSMSDALRLSEITLNTLGIEQ